MPDRTQDAYVHADGASAIERHGAAGCVRFGRPERGLRREPLYAAEPRLEPCGPQVS